MTDNSEYGKLCCQSENCYSTILSERKFSPVKARYPPMTELEKQFIEKMRQLSEEDFKAALRLLEFVIECRENSFAAPEKDAEIS